MSALKTDIDALRQRGADQFDRLGFFHLDVLARRAMAHQGPVRHLLEGKLAQKLVALRDNFEQAQTESQQALDQLLTQHPQADAELRQHHDSGDFAAVKQGIARLKHRGHRTLLGELAGQFSHQPLQAVADSLGTISSAAVHPELTATQYFRKTWAKLSIDKRVTQALGQAPKNAGPINSHMLVLRSLALMRDISPDYLNRLTVYVDTLLCLDQGDKHKQAKSRKTAEAIAGRSMKSRPARRLV